MITRQIKSTVLRGFILPLIFTGFATVNLFPVSNDSTLLNKIKDASNEEKREENIIILKLEQAVMRVLLQNKDLLAHQWDIRAKDGTIIQESLLPNPEIEVQMENFAGSRETRGFSQAETTVQVGQTILLGGKRKKKIKAAKLDKVVSLRDYDRKLSDLLYETKKRFITILLIQKKLALRKEMVELAEKFLKKISVRIKAGRTSPVELSRAKVSLFRNKLALERLKKEMFAARQLLAALWGSCEPDFEKVKGRLDIYSFVPGIDKFKNRLSQNTYLKYISSEVDYRKSLLTLEKAYKIPNPKVLGGIRRLNESRSTAFTLSLSIPIPIINRNQGAIKTADYLLKKSEYSYQAAEVMIKNELIASHKMLQSAYSSAWKLKTQILPEALNAFTTITKGYDLGKFGYLEVLDAYRTYLEVREEYLENAANYWHLMAEIESLTGENIKLYKVQKIEKGEKNETE